MTEVPPREWRPTPLLRVAAAIHLAAVAGVVATPRRWPLAAGAVLASHIALAAAGMWPRSRLLGDNLVRLPAADPEPPEVALTFDDGPDPEVTPRVLDLLEQAGARATFFCVGRRAAAHRPIIAEAVARGHRVENHSFSHPNAFALLGPRRLGDEIDRAQEILASAGGRRPAYFRAPAGIRSPWLAPALVRRRLALVSWTRRGFDAVDRDARRVSRRLLCGLAPRDILLLHDGSLVRSGSRPPIVLEVLPRVLDALAAAGLSAVALPAEAPRA
jgi:peptidoglycan/xylan/chitin deacetylase (PgdA/CDA1 family)